MVPAALGLGGCPTRVGLANLRPPLHQDPDLGGGYPVPNKDAAELIPRMVAVGELR